MMDVEHYLAGAKHCVEIEGQCDQCPVQDECHCEHWPRAFIKAAEHYKAETEAKKEAHKSGLSFTELTTAVLTRAAMISEVRAQLEARIGPDYHNEWNSAIRSMLYEIQQMERDEETLDGQD